MSNAMRSGKRWLAGVAAGALGAGVLTIASASPAQAGIATSVAFDFPSVTVVATAANFSSIATPLNVLDSAGEVADDTTGIKIQLSLTKPGTSTIADDSVVFYSQGDDTVTAAAAGSRYIDANVTEMAGLKTATVLDAGSLTNGWAALDPNGVGTYTLTAQLFNSATGAKIGSAATLNLNVVTVAGVPSVTTTFHNNASALNVIDQYGVAKDDSLATFNVSVATADGGPLMIRDDSVSLTNWSSATGTFTPSHQGVAGVYTQTPVTINSSGSTTGSQLLTAKVTSAVGTTKGTSTLPVQVAETKNASAPAVTVSGTNVAGTGPYYMPVGSTEFTVNVTTPVAVASGSVAWNASSDAVGGATEKSGGAVAISNSLGSFTVKPNAKASAKDKAVTVVVQGSTTVVVNFVAAAATLDGSAGIAKVGDAAPVSGTITDQWGQPLAGTWTVKMTASGTSIADCLAASGTSLLASATASAAGAWSLDVPAAQSPTSATSKGFAFCASNGLSSTASTKTVTVVYTATGGVNSLSATVQRYTGSGVANVASGSYAVTTVPDNGVVPLANDQLTRGTVSATTPELADPNAANTGDAVNINVVVDPANTKFTVSGSDGVRFTTTKTGSIAYSNAKATVSTDDTNIRAFANKPGVHTVTITAGTTTTEVTFVTGVAKYSGRVITANPSSVQVGKGNFVTLTATVTDIYGNPVPGDDSVYPTLFGGGTISVDAGKAAAATDANGQTAVSYVAPAGTGDAEVTFTMATGSFVTATDYTGDPALVKSAKVAITVTGGPTEKSISIIGERATVKGKSGVIFEGVTTGIEAGKTVKPWIKFPGQTSYSEGTARPEISAVGDFTWQRKTGKKIYVYFTNDDDSVKSNRVIIQAK